MRNAFTLVEILIVVVILGILAAIVIPQFAQASVDAQTTATYTEVQKLRRHIEVFKVRNSNALPSVAVGDGTWGELVGVNGEYLMAPPYNAWVGEPHGHDIIFGTGPDTAFHQDYGWIYDPTTGDIWAGAFDANDQPLPRP